jgi:AraC-like DNA-binding protein
MKQQTSGIQNSPIALRYARTEQFFEKEPFFKPVKKIHSSIVYAKAFSNQNQHCVLLSLNGDTTVFMEELTMFLRRSCGFRNEVQVVFNLAELSAEFEPQQAQGSHIDEQVTSDSERNFLKTVNGLIDENLGEEAFRVSDIAKQLCCCEMQLYRKLKKLTSLSPANYIRRYRLHCSLRLLENHANSISEICFKVGFNSLEYFSRSFKKEFGKCPTEYRASINV